MSAISATGTRWNVSWRLFGSRWSTFEPCAGFSGASAQFSAKLNATKWCLFAQGGGYDTHLPFDDLVSKEEKALSSDGERDYLVRIGTVPVFSSIAGVERVQNTLPMSINARQVDNPVQDD